MKRNYIIAASFILLVAFEGCKKETTSDKPEAIVIAKDLIRVIKWNTTGAQAELLYNQDSTLKTINYSGSGSSYGIDYLYKNTRLWSMELGSSLHRFEYYYDNDGRVTNVKRRNDGENSFTQDLEFSYNSNGTVAVLKYYQINESGKKLVYTNTYIYGSALELTEISSTAQNGTKFLFIVESYSDQIKFDPLWFIGADLNEEYMIYNYPVLSTMRRLPARIKKLKITNDKAVAEKIVTINSVIKSGRLEKQNTLIRYPDRQGSDSYYETVYIY